RCRKRFIFICPPRRQIDPNGLITHRIKPEGLGCGGNDRHSFRACFKTAVSPFCGGPVSAAADVSIVEDVCSVAYRRLTHGTLENAPVSFHNTIADGGSDPAMPSFVPRRNESCPSHCHARCLAGRS